MIIRQVTVWGPRSIAIKGTGSTLKAEHHVHMRRYSCLPTFNPTLNYYCLSLLICDYVGDGLVLSRILRPSDF